MRKKNSNSSVPSGMHSLAQRSQQERRQKMEQQRTRTVPQEPMRVPPQQPAHFGRQPMQQVPPPPVQKPAKAISREALPGNSAAGNPTAGGIRCLQSVF